MTPPNPFGCYCTCLLHDRPSSWRVFVGLLYTKREKKSLTKEGQISGWQLPLNYYDKYISCRLMTVCFSLQNLCFPVMWLCFFDQKHPFRHSNMHIHRHTPAQQLWRASGKPYNKMVVMCFTTDKVQTVWSLIHIPPCTHILLSFRCNCTTLLQNITAADT